MHVHVHLIERLSHYITNLVTSHLTRDGVSSYTSKHTVAFVRANEPNFTELNSPDLNPIDYIF